MFEDSFIKGKMKLSRKIIEYMRMLGIRTFGTLKDMKEMELTTKIYVLGNAKWLEDLDDKSTLSFYWNYKRVIQEQKNTITVKEHGYC